MNLPTRIRTSVKAFIVRNHKILVLKERVTREGNVVVIHDVPGGGIEYTESLIEALQREVKEEVGLTVEVERPVGGWDFFIPKPHENLHIVCIGFQCRLVGESTIVLTENPAAYEDIFEARWLSKDEIFSQAESLFQNSQMRESMENVKF